MEGAFRNPGDGISKRNSGLRGGIAPGGRTDGPGICRLGIVSSHNENCPNLPLAMDANNDAAGPGGHPANGCGLSNFC